MSFDPSSFRLNSAYFLDPNGNTTTNAKYWPAHDVEAGNHNMIQLLGGNVSVIRDTYREEQMAFLNTKPKQFAY